MSLAPFANEPSLDLSSERERTEIGQAVVQVEHALGRAYGLRIGGRHEAPTDRRMVSVSPARPDRVVGEITLATAEDAARAVEAAKAAQPAWAQVPVEERAAFLLRAGDVLRRRRRDLLAWMAFEVGKNFGEGDGEVGESIDHFEWNARRIGDRAQGRAIQPLASEFNHYRYLPLGVGVVISPWNFPCALPLGMLVAAVAAGNAVVFKPAEEASVIANQLVDVFEEAGLPPGVLNLVTGLGEELGPSLISHPDVRFVSFVGSRAVGVEVYRQASAFAPGQREMRRVMTEMGGKNAGVVAADADLELTADEIVKSAFGYQGQKCSALSRLIVERPVYQRLIDMVVARAHKLSESAGLPWENAPYGPVVREEAADRIEEYAALAPNEGRVVLTGGRMNRPGYYLAPTVVADVSPSARLWREEVFGPLLVCTPADSFEHAIDLANDSDYALTGSAFSQNPKNLALARERFYVGNLYLNRGCTGAMAGVHPFGGFRQSGTGPKVGGPDYLGFFTQAQLITERVRF